MMRRAQPTTESGARRSGQAFGRARWLVPLALGALLVGGASPFLAPLSENYHLVIPARVYRSGQLNSQSLHTHVTQQGIHSIINLRGANLGEAWYDQERAVAREQNLTLYDLPVDSRCPTASELRELLDVLPRCPKPVLIHCQSGIDRSGIVAAISILLLDASGSIEMARSHLGWRYGHMPWCENLSIQEKFLERYEAWLKSQGQVHDPAHFRAWLAAVSENGNLLSSSRSQP